LTFLSLCTFFYWYASQRRWIASIPKAPEVPLCFFPFSSYCYYTIFVAGYQTISAICGVRYITLVIHRLSTGGAQAKCLAHFLALRKRLAHFLGLRKARSLRIEECDIGHNKKPHWVFLDKEK